MMLARNEETKPNLYLEYCRQAVERSQLDAERQGPLRAEVLPGGGKWRVLIIAAGHEKIAAGHLIGRGFGIFLPEAQYCEVRRGRKVEGLKLMLPGYLFVYVWQVERQKKRILSCPGVIGFLSVPDCTGYNTEVTVTWDEINALRAAENAERPLVMTIETIVAPRKRQRQSRKPRIVTKQVQVNPADIEAIHAYSPLIEAMRNNSAEVRLSAFHKAMGLTESAR